MPKTKSTQTDRTKRAPRDPGPERQEETEVWRPYNPGEKESDGVVDEEQEFDTNKYEAPRKG